MSATEFEPGDLVRYSVVGIVDSVEDNFLYVKEAQGKEPMVFPINLGYGRYRSARTDLIHRAKKKPPVGSYITGQTLKNTMWKRGTTFINDSDEIITVTADGELRVQNTIMPRIHQFSDLHPGKGSWGARFKLVHLGGSECGEE